MVAGARVRLTGPSVSRRDHHQQSGTYSFAAAPPNTYRIDVTAPGLSGSKTVTLGSDPTLEVQIELTVNAVKESVTVTGEADAPVPVQSSSEAVIDKSTVFNAPNRNRSGRCSPASHSGRGPRTGWSDQHERRPGLARRNSGQQWKRNRSGNR